jgi:hypothetical protein
VIHHGSVHPIFVQLAVDHNSFARTLPTFFSAVNPVLLLPRISFEVDSVSPSLALTFPSTALVGQLVVCFRWGAIRVVTGAPAIVLKCNILKVGASILARVLVVAIPLWAELEVSVGVIFVAANPPGTRFHRRSRGWRGSWSQGGCHLT